MDVTNSECRLYNLDHTLWKTIDLPVPEGQYVYDIKYVSDNLFNTDNVIELAYVYYLYVETGQYYIYETRVINENGNVLVTIPGASWVEVLNAGDDNYKFIAYIWDYSSYPYYVSTSVYDVPGNLTYINNKINSFSQSMAYPNPSESMVVIPYNLEAAGEGEIQLLDATGKIIKSYRVDRHFTSIQINTQSFPPGLYFHRLMVNGEYSPSNKLIIK